MQRGYNARYSSQTQLDMRAKEVVELAGQKGFCLLECTGMKEKAVEANMECPNVKKRAFEMTPWASG
ncbi:hypothetical protein H920_15555 [Fukomys damarensis]|uniref:Uncharacterized protein n=1 Tax=Fukomys damarensis TaxID=885580 RepID=A0A091CYS7_FUKDA|nr:hypothetical protein H920_15555 [Fukomys damarensis]